VSPQHRMLVQTSDHDQVLVPAKSLIDRIGVRRMNGRKTVEYVHLVFDRHEIVSAEGCWSESFFPGAYALSQADRRTRAELFAIYSGLATSGPPQNARRLIKATQARDMAPLVAAQ
ncbi:MAG: Hint domain-containing protein, partial [Pseudomonadota bacterium]